MPEEPSERAIRQAVVGRYAARARAALDAAGARAAATAGATACCAPEEGPGSAPGPAKLEFLDLEATGAAAAGGAIGAVCDPNDPDCVAGDAPPVDDPALRFGAAHYDDTAGIPEGALAASAGCGNPTAIAELRPGEHVLDLGSGGGIDCFLAARQVGEDGRVWGLDMTPEMVQLARHNADQVGASNVRFRLGEIEDIPFADGAFDAIISNCVINLSTDKPRVFREAFRVLRPGGRLRVSDMVWTRPVAAEARSAEQWAGCIAGALPLDEYLEVVRAAGFIDVEARCEETASGLASAYVSATRP